ncbi:hypothetical protein IQ283_05370 [Alkalihalobacillus hwajinpoensis]|uniref:hypothetical protein n=1 Tax=Guptibacillus hwajinpoensis TaxID=208199 RepID=UPI00188412A2|nr:hypothetical protein [Pseudalkalibacillus hwajinpoensis]MBF0706031.1 hypothetical protein [Pseudalkalibacillus hwajinpoensis]
MREKFMDVFVAVVFGGALTFFGPFLIVYFFDDTPEVNIGESLKIDNEQFMTPIELSTFKEGIDELKISIPVTISQEQVKSNTPLTISLLENNIKTAVGTDIYVTNISEDKNVQLGIVTTEEINDEKISVASSNSKINTSKNYFQLFFYHQGSNYIEFHTAPPFFPLISFFYYTTITV